MGFLEAGLVEDPFGGMFAVNFWKGQVGWVNERRIDVVVDEGDGKSTFLPLQVCEGKFF